MKKNKGYTLVEMLIVLAIMAILSGLAAVSVGLIRKAKIQDAITSFDSQLTNLWIQTKSMAAKQKSMYAELKLAGDHANGDGIYTFTISDPEAGTTETQTYDKWDKYVDIIYDGTEFDNNTSVKIQFDKSTGAVVSGNGAGDYVFQDKAGNVVATIHVDRITGSHYLK